jgi:hypothetical protein
MLTMIGDPCLVWFEGRGMYATDCMEFRAVMMDGDA